MGALKEHCYRQQHHGADEYSQDDSFPFRFPFRESRGVIEP
jgi:hypothetical protein